MLPLFLLALMSPAPPSAPAFAPPVIRDEPTPEWRTGPVRYILSVKEDSTYRRLKTREERQAFIQRFWEALDPTPGTAVNERRKEFWDRVDRAEHLFLDSVFPGWKTDRGKIYILFGPPHDLSRTQYGDTWTYRALPNPAGWPELRLWFYKGRDGAYRLSSTPAAYKGPAYRSPFRMNQGESSLSQMGILAGAQVVKDRIWMPELKEGFTEADYFFGSILSIQRFLYRKAGDGTTHVTLTVAVPAGQFQKSGEPPRVPEMVLSLTVVEEATGKVSLRLREKMARDPGWDPASGRSAPFQIEFGLSPGSYRADYSLFDAVSHLGSSFAETLSVPDFRIGLSMSDISLAHPPEGPPEDDQARHATPHPFPDPAPSFCTGEILQFSYEVYNAERSGTETALEVEYVFFYRSGTELWQVGKPVLLHGVTQTSLGYILPLTRWPAGEYLLQVRVNDSLAGATVEREIAFTLLAATTGVPSTAPGPNPLP